MAPLAAAVAPDRVSAKRQSLPHFVAHAPWSDARVLGKVRELVLPALERGGPVEAWIVDDTGLPRKGKHSVGVARQYCGQLGKQDNGQVAVSLSLASETASLPIAWRLYLPRTWARDAGRRKAGVPKEVVFKTKPESVLGLNYVMSVLSSTSLWSLGQAPLAPKSKGGRGRLGMRLKPRAWQTLTWRDGANTPLSGRFAALRVRPAHRDHTLFKPRPRERLLIEWPPGEDEPTKYWLSTLPADTRRAAFAGQAKMRWRVRRDDQELKQEVELGHDEGRGWRGFHHHATLCIAACGFLISQRETIPPSGPRSSTTRKAFSFPEGDRPRGGADPARASRHPLNRNGEANHRHPIGLNTPALPMLPKGMGKTE